MDDFESEPPPKTAAPHVESARGIIVSFLKASRAHQLYPRHSRIRVEHGAEFAEILVRHVETYGETDLKFRQTKIVWGEEPVYQEENRQKSLAFKLFVNGVRGITLSPGVDAKEAEAFIDALCRSLEKEATNDDLRTVVWEAGFLHVRFALTDDLFSAEDEKSFADFVETGSPRHDSAVGARTECDEEMNALMALPDAPTFAAEESAALRLTPEDRTALAADVQAECARDLFAEFSAYLVEELSSDDAEAAQARFGEFLDHVLASGEILRAARFLKALRDLATETADVQKRRLLHEVLERLGEAKIVPKIRPLVPALIEGDREALMLLLSAVGEPAIHPLCDLLDTPAKGAALDALRILAPRHPKALLPFLLDARPAVVRSVMTLLADVGSEDVAAGFLPALRHPDIGVRREAIRALTKFGGHRATDIFIAALADKGYEVRALALGALGDGKDPKAASHLIRRINEPGFHALTHYEKRETFRALAKIGTSEATTALLRILNSKTFLQRARNDEQRALAASALGMIDSQPARHALAAHAKDRSDDVRRAVATAMSQSKATPSS
jgi:HEAT repeat protein